MKKIFLWGTGQVAETLWTQCQTLSQYELLGFIDNNVEKQGNFFKNLPIYPPQILEQHKPDFIVILTEAYDEIYQQIMLTYPELQDIVKDKNFFYMESLLKRYYDTTEPEEIEAINYIKKNGLHIFNYDFVEKYRQMPVKPYWDVQKQMFYVLHKNRRLYFSKELCTEEKVTAYYRNICLEQDVYSPHRYITDDFNVCRGDIVIDAGAAEGNFSLQVIDKVSKIYIVETDVNWVEALKETFKDYSEKVIIIQKFLSSYNEGNYATLDTLVDEPVNFIKMDIEGNEWDALWGATSIIRKSKNLKCAICAYHSDFDRTLIEDFMRKNELDYSATPGLIWFPWTIRQNYVSTKLNKAIVRGIRNTWNNDRV